MTRGTIKLPEDDFRKHNNRRKEMGLSWPEYIDGQAPDITEEIKDAVRDVLSEEYDLEPSDE